MIFQEGELFFDFTGCITAERFNGSFKPPYRMKAVDFIVEEENRTLLIEVKDPCDSRARSDPRTQEILKDLRCGVLIDRQLLLKCRDSYLYLHLMTDKEEDNKQKPFVYVVVLGVDCERSFDAALLGNLQDRLQKRLRQESDVPWKRPYVQAGLLLTISAWSKYFSYRLHRSTANSANPQ